MHAGCKSFFFFKLCTLTLPELLLGVEQKRYVQLGVLHHHVQMRGQKTTFIRGMDSYLFMTFTISNKPNPTNSTDIYEMLPLNVDACKSDNQT